MKYKLPKSLTTVTPFSKALALLLFILLPFATFYFGLNLGLTYNNEYSVIRSFNNGSFCTMDAKQCPDGSYVSRAGPNCQFTECPNINPTTFPKPTTTPNTTPTCIPRPKCLDMVPRCMIAESSDMCPPTVTPEE